MGGVGTPPVLRYDPFGQDLDPFMERPVFGEESLPGFVRLELLRAFDAGERVDGAPVTVGAGDHADRPRGFNRAIRVEPAVEQQPFRAALLCHVQAAADGRLPRDLVEETLIGDEDRRELAQDHGGGILVERQRRFQRLG